MKTTPNLQKSAFLAVLIMLSGLSVSAQSKGSGNLTKQDRTVEPFTEIEAGSAFVVKLSQGEPQQLSISADDNYINNIETTVENNRLVITSSGIKNPSAMNIYIKVPNITLIDLQGAARLDSDGVLKGASLTIEASGASKTYLELDVMELKSEISGASKVVLLGTAQAHKTEVSGASSLDALKLSSQAVDAEISGAAKAKIYAVSEINADLSGAGSLIYFDNDEIRKLNKPGNYTLNFQNPETPGEADMEGVISSTESGDSTLINIGDVSVQVIEGNPTKVTVGGNELVVDEDGNVKFNRKRKDRFDGHWGGFDMGINGYLNSDNKFDMPQGYDFLDLRMEKSINVALNFWEQNFNLIGNQFGLTTGLGFEWNNYRFDNNIKIDRDDELGIVGMELDEDGVGYFKSKLVVNYLNLPLLLEYQTNRFSKKNSFHIGGGLLTGLRIGAHTKMVYDDGSKQKDKDRDSKGFDLNPFKFSLMARIGWGKINLYGNYSLNTLFKDGHGPELYPFAVGITLAGW